MLRLLLISIMVGAASLGSAHEIGPHKPDETQASFREGFLDEAFPLTRELLKPALISEDFIFDWRRVAPRRETPTPPDDFRPLLKNSKVYFDAPPRGGSSTFYG
ncbi:hypothetical protein Pla108_07500 [Botrimarina colliarenosi]|uniref:Uncharacterized protein n=1 Tax=Botrimarina colliarenosi TaxID=2528001 RepID=A0A5C6AJZ5_9BACT|nr:hypothetical protein Pla108_07500 [Botrimarina colliarenosi]